MFFLFFSGIDGLVRSVDGSAFAFVDMCESWISRALRVNIGASMPLTNLSSWQFAGSFLCTH